MTTKTHNFTGILNRLLIIFLLFTFMVTAGSFILRQRINNKLDKLGKQLNATSCQQGIGALLVDLDVAENNFQKASADGQPSDLAAYQRGLDTIFRGMTAIIQRYQQGGDTSLPGSRGQIEKGLQQKLKLSQQLFSLRKNFDSLLRVTTFAGIHRRIGQNAVNRIENVRADTIVTTRQEANKSGLLHRLKEALHSTRSVKVLDRP